MQLDVLWSIVLLRFCLIFCQFQLGVAFRSVAYTKKMCSYNQSLQAATMCYVRKAVLKNFAKFTGKHLCQSLFFNKVADGGLQLYEKGDSNTGVLVWILENFYKQVFYRTPLGNCFCGLQKKDVSSVAL